MTRWIGLLFAVGAACFAVGAAPAFVDAVGTDTDSVTFFVGSLFFTTAAGLQWFAWRSDPARHRIDGWAALVQLAGTLFFNWSTFHAMDDQLTAAQTDRLVWTPDARGSLCFLVSSGLAWIATNHRAWRWHPRERDWQIAALNLAGSVAFAVSAVASYVVPETDQERNVALMNLGTFVGALGFFVAALLLLPAQEDAAVPT
jgi:YrhK-like protein